MSSINNSILDFKTYEKRKKKKYSLGIALYIYYNFLEKEINYIEFRKARLDIKFINKFNKPKNLNNNLFINFFKNLIKGNNILMLKKFKKIFLLFFKYMYTMLKYNENYIKLSSNSIQNDKMNLFFINYKKILKNKFPIELEKYDSKIILIKKEFLELGDFYNIKNWLITPFNKLRVGIIFKKKTFIKKSKRKIKKVSFFPTFSYGFNDYMHTLRNLSLIFLNKIKKEDIFFEINEEINEEVYEDNKQLNLHMNYLYEDFFFKDKQKSIFFKQKKNIFNKFYLIMIKKQKKYGIFK